MNRLNPENESSSESRENDKPTFTEKFSELLPGVEFDESAEMFEARMAVLEVLKGDNQDPDFLRSVWTAYSDVSEQAVDSKAPSDAEPDARSRLQIAALLHKALIFREAGDIQRYGEDLTDAREYAYNAYLDEIDQAIGSEIDNL